MTDNKQNAAAGSKPQYIAYQVRDGKDKGFFTRIGAAWPTKRGNALQIQLDSLPLNGRITLLPASEAKD